jgi:hypothetical protein
MGEGFVKGSPYNLFFDSPGVEHADRFHTTSVRCFNVQVSSHWLDQLGKHTPGLNPGREFYGGPAIRLAMNLHNEFRFMDDAAALAIEGLMLEIVAEASRQVKPGSNGKSPGESSEPMSISMSISMNQSGWSF